MAEDLAKFAEEAETEIKFKVEDINFNNLDFNVPDAQVESFRQSLEVQEVSIKSDISQSIKDNVLSSITTDSFNDVTKSSSEMAIKEITDPQVLDQISTDTIDDLLISHPEWNGDISKASPADISNSSNKAVSKQLTAITDEIHTGVSDGIADAIAGDPPVISDDIKLEMKNGIKDALGDPNSFKQANDYVTDKSIGADGKVDPAKVQQFSDDSIAEIEKSGLSDETKATLKKWAGTGLKWIMIGATVGLIYKSLTGGNDPISKIIQKAGSVAAGAVDKLMGNLWNVAQKILKPVTDFLGSVWTKIKKVVIIVGIVLLVIIALILIKKMRDAFSSNRSK